jgi:SPP1 gp7 family putative phage head morphogenesis protein
MGCFCCNSKTDPTNTGRQRRELFKQIRERLKAAYKEVKALIESIPYTVETVPDSFVTNRQRYTYQLTGRDVNKEIAAILARYFGTDADLPPRWFFTQPIDEAYQNGTLQSAARLAAFASDALTEAQLRNVLMSPAYLRRIELLNSRVFEEMKGFVGDTAADLARVLAQDIGRGVGIRTITSDIAERFDVSRSRAEKIARTEVGQAQRTARREQALEARDDLGLDVALQWISALAPTTRPTHRARHLKIYTIEEVADFYSRDGNPINCLCVTTEVVKTKGGKILGERKK